MTTSKIRLWTAASLTLIPTLILILMMMMTTRVLAKNQRDVENQQKSLLALSQRHSEPLTLVLAVLVKKQRELQKQA